MGNATFEYATTPFWQVNCTPGRPQYALKLKSNEHCVDHPALLRIEVQTSDHGQFAVFDGLPLAVNNDFASATPNRRLAAALDVCQNLSLLHEQVCSPTELSLTSLVFDEGRLLIVPVGQELSQELLQYDAHRLCQTILSLFGGTLGATPPLTNDNVLNGLLLRLSQSTPEAPALEVSELLNAIARIHAHHQQRNTAITFNVLEPTTADDYATRVIETAAVPRRRTGLWLSLTALVALSVAAIGYYALPAPIEPTRMGVQVEIIGLNDGSANVAHSVLNYHLMNLLSESREFNPVSAQQLPSGVPDNMLWRSLGAESGVTATLRCVTPQQCQLETRVADINNQVQRLAAPVALSYNAPNPVKLRELLSSLLDITLPLNDYHLSADDYRLINEADAAIAARGGLSTQRLDALFNLAQQSKSPLISRKLLEVVKNQNDPSAIPRMGALIDTLENDLNERDYLSLEIAYEVYLRRNTDIQPQLNQLGILELDYGVQEDDVLTRAARHFYLNDPQSAYNELATAIEAVPSWRLESAAIWYASGVLANLTLVEQHVESLLRFQPDNRAVRAQQLNVAIPRERIDWLQEAAEFFTDDIDRRNQALAWIAIFNNDWEEAKQLTESAYLALKNAVNEDESVNASLSLLYADTLLKTGHIEASHQIYQQLLQRYDEGDPLVTRATAMQAMWHTQSAEAALTEFSETTGNSSTDSETMNITLFWLYRAVDHPDTAKLRERCLAQGISPRLLELDF